MSDFIAFEEELLALVEKYFAGEHDGTKCAALAVVLGAIIGAGSVTIIPVVESVAQRVTESAIAVRKLREEILLNMVPETGTKQ